MTTDNATQQAYQRLQQALKQKYQSYEQQTHETINASKDQAEREYYQRSVLFRFQNTGKTTYSGTIYIESINAYFSDLWLFNNKIEFLKTNITKLNTILNLFPLYQSISNIEEISQDDALAEYWWKSRFLAILEEIYELLKKKDLQGLTYSGRNFNITLPRRNPFKIINSTAYRTGITKAEYNNTLQLFKNLKDVLKKHYALKSVSNIISFIDVYYSEFKDRKYVILETDEQVEQYEKTKEEAIKNIQVNWNLKPAYILKQEPKQEELEIEEIEEIEDF